MAETRKLVIDRARIAANSGKKKLPTTTLALSGIGALANPDVPNLPRYVKRLNLLLWGPPGTSKTVTSHTLPNTRTLDLDDGMQSVEWAIKKGTIKKDPSEIVYKTILPDPRDRRSTRVIDECTDTVDEWLADEDIPPEEWDKPYPQFWDTLIIDGGSGLMDASMIKALHENARLELSHSLSRLTGRVGIVPMMIQDWGSAGSLFQSAINQWRAIGKNLVLICHEYIEYETTIGKNGQKIQTGTIDAICPLAIGQLRHKLPKDFDEVWYSHVTGTRQKPEYKVQTTPDPLRQLRSRLGCLDPIEAVDFAAIKKKIARFYEVPEDRLWIAAHGAAEREQVQIEEAEESGGI